MQNNHTQFKQTEIGLIPENWDVLELKDVCKTISDTYNLKNKNEIVFLNTSDVYKGKVLNHIPTSTNGLPGQAKKKIQKGDILYSEIRPANKRYAFIDFNAEEFVVSTKFMVLRPDQTIDSKYLLIFLSSPEVLNCFQVLAESRSGTFPQITFDTIKHSLIPIPSLPEQRKIAEVLGALDDKIELNRKMNKTLEALGQAIFKRWFINSDNKHFDLIKLGEKITILKGKNITKKTITEGDIPVVAGGLNPSCYHDTPNTIAPVISISASGANAGFIRLYHENVWASDCSYIDKSVTPYVFFYYLFLLENKEAVSGLQRGSAQPHVYPKDLMELIIADFDERLIQRFEKSVTPIFKKIKINEEEIETLSQIRNSLLPRLMSGKLRVK